MRSLHPRQQSVPYRPVQPIFATIVVYASKWVMERASNASVQRVGQVHDVNTVSVLVSLNVTVEERRQMIE